MARVNNLTNFLNDVATAIKQKTGDNTPIPASEFDTEILSIETGGNYQSKSISITQNGNYNLLPDQEFDALSNVNISVSVSPVLQNKTITQNGQYTADSGYTGLGTVTVNVPSGSGDVKLFETEQAMQADPDASEGDLAVVYREELTGVTEENEFSSCIFPNTVVLDEAFTGNVYGRFRAVDHSVMFDGNVDMSSSRFRFNGWGESSQVRVEYTSQDGITYTRTDGGEELQEFGTVIKYEPMGPWNDVFGNFMKIGGNYFEGLFQYLNVDTNNQLTFNPSSLNISDTTINLVQAGPILNYEILKSAAKYLSQFYTDDEFQFDAYIDYENKVHIIYAKSGYNSFGKMFIVNKSSPVIYMGTSGSTFTEHFDAIYDDIEKTFKNEQSIAFTTMFKNISSSGFNCVKINGYPICSIGIQQYNYDKWRHFNSTIYYLDTIDSSTNINITDSNLKLNEMITKYILTTTQLNATADDVYEKTFYGKNGVENGTLQNKENLTKNMVKHRVNIWSNYNSGIICPSDTSNMLGGCKNLTTIPLLNTSKVTNMGSMFSRCTSLTTIPQLDTSSATNMNSMFYNCTSLTAIPLLDTSNVTSMNSMFNGCTSLTTIPLLNTSNATDTSYMLGGCTNLTTIPLLNTSNVTNMSYMFSNCTSLTAIPELDTSSATSMNNMFNACTNLTTIPLLNTSSATNMNSMFYNCTSLTAIPLLDTSNVTSMNSMFNGCTSLTTIPLLNTSNATDTSYMLGGCTNLTTIPLLNTSSATSMNYMFSNCTNLTTIPELDTSSATSMYDMFYNCTNLTTIPELDTSSATNTSYMFSRCTSLTTIPLLNTSNVTNMSYMFSNCTSLTAIPLLDTSNVTNMSGMFNACTNLTTIPLLNTSSATNMNSMFYNCTNLTTIPQLDTSNVTNMYGAFDDCTSLSDESLNNILAICKNATSYTSTKTLKYIGITSEQATKCKTLSNYQAFTNAGWTTGY